MQCMCWSETPTHVAVNTSPCEGPKHFRWPRYLWGACEDDDDGMKWLLASCVVCVCVWRYVRYVQAPYARSRIVKISQHLYMRVRASECVVCISATTTGINGTARNYTTCFNTNTIQRRRDGNSTGSSTTAIHWRSLLRRNTRQVRVRCVCVREKWMRTGGPGGWGCTRGRGGFLSVVGLVRGARSFTLCVSLCVVSVSSLCSRLSTLTCACALYMRCQMFVYVCCSCVSPGTFTCHAFGSFEWLLK